MSTVDPKSLRVLSVNAHESNHHGSDWAAWLYDTATEQDVDVICCQELSSRTWWPVATHLEGGAGSDGFERWHKLRRADWPGADDQGILVRPGLRVGDEHVNRVGRIRWFGRHTRRLHPGRSLPHLLVDGWLRIGSVHMPPGVSYRRHTAGDRAYWAMHGRLDRRAAWLACMRATDRWLDARWVDRAVLLPGDWNGNPADPGWMSLPWLAQRHEAEFHGDRIDCALAIHCTATRLRYLAEGPGMDHPALLLTVTQED